MKTLLSIIVIIFFFSLLYRPKSCTDSRARIYLKEIATKEERSKLLGMKAIEKDGNRIYSWYAIPTLWGDTAWYWVIISKGLLYNSSIEDLINIKTGYNSETFYLTSPWQNKIMEIVPKFTGKITILDRSDLKGYSELKEFEYKISKDKLAWIIRNGYFNFVRSVEENNRYIELYDTYYATYVSSTGSMEKMWHLEIVEADSTNIVLAPNNFKK